MTPLTPCLTEGFTSLDVHMKVLCSSLLKYVDFSSLIVAMATQGVIAPSMAAVHCARSRCTRSRVDWITSKRLFWNQTPGVKWELRFSVGACWPLTRPVFLSKLTFSLFPRLVWQYRQAGRTLKVLPMPDWLVFKGRVWDKANHLLRSFFLFSFFF